MKYRLYNQETNTFPYIVHGNGGRWAEQWSHIYRDYLSGDVIPCESCPLLTIYTWNTQDKISPLEKSLRLMGISCVVLGKGKQWYVGAQTEWTAEYLETCKTQYAMGLDAFDVLILESPTQILRTYLNYFGNKVLFAAELNSWPQHPELETFESLRPEARGRFIHLNGGCVIGPTALLREVYKTALQKEDTVIGNTQQVWVRRAHQRMQNDVTLDYRCQIFQCLYNTDCVKGIYL